MAGWMRRAAMALLAGLILTVAAGSLRAQDEEAQGEYQELIQQSVELIQSGQYDEAKKVLNQAIEVYPKDPISYYNLACIYSLENNVDEAIAWLEESAARGFVDVYHMKTDGDLDNIRGNESYKKIIEKYTPKSELSVPANYDKEKKYPMMVFLHGAGSNPADIMVPLKAALGEEWIILCPPAGRILGPNSYIWDPQRDVTSVPNEIEYVRGKYTVDPDRIYLGGFSMGGTFSYTLGMNFPEMFAGMMPFGGALDGRFVSQETAEKANSLPVFIVHGTKDDVIPVKVAEGSAKALEGLQYKTRIHTFDGAHVLPPDLSDVLREGISFIDEARGRGPKADKPATPSDDPPGEDF